MKNCGRIMDHIKKVANLSLEGNLSTNWKKFLQSNKMFETAAELSDKKEEVKIATFLNALGEEALELFPTFDLSDADKKSYEKVIKSYEDYCTPKKNVVYERFLFYTRNQMSGEPFENFLTAIKKLVKSCEFEAQENSLLRDRIVLGTSHKNVQEKLLQTSNLTLEAAIDFCKTAETTREYARVI